MGILRDIGAPGLIIIILGALLIFGPKRLPELGQSIGKMFAEFKTAVNKGSEEADQDAKEDKKYRILMLVGRKNCRKIVQFLVEPLMKKQSISQQVSGFFCILFIQIGSNIRRLQGSLFVYQIP